MVIAIKVVVGLFAFAILHGLWIGAFGTPPLWLDLLLYLVLIPTVVLALLGNRGAIGTYVVSFAFLVLANIGAHVYGNFQASQHDHATVVAAASIAMAQVTHVAAAHITSTAVTKIHLEATATAAPHVTATAHAFAIAQETATARETVTARQQVARAHTTAQAAHATAAALAQGAENAKLQGSPEWWFREDLFRANTFGLDTDQFEQDNNSGDIQDMPAHCSGMRDNVGAGTVYALHQLHLPGVYQPYLDRAIQDAQNIQDLGDSCKSDASSGNINAVGNDYLKAQAYVDDLLRIAHQLFPGQNN